MSGAFYARMGKTAKRLLTAYGKQLTFVRVVNGSYNPSSGKVAQVSSTYNATGQAFTYSDYATGQSGGLIKTGDRRILIAAVDLSFIPDSTTDKIVLNGVEWDIIRVTKPVDEKVLYELQVRLV